jgi:hypothetical protein
MSRAQDAQERPESVKNKMEQFDSKSIEPDGN